MSDKGRIILALSSERTVVFSLRTDGTGGELDWTAICKDERVSCTARGESGFGMYVNV